MASRNTDKGTYLELRVARLLLAQGLTPFVNVWYRSGLDLNSISYPDVDVMGCRFLPDCTIFFAHYDCKSGESNVINRVLLLAGLRAFLPPGPIVYVRKRTSLDIKRYAMQYGVKIADIAQIEKKEEEFVKPIFGENFPSICDEQIHKLWLSSQRQHKNEQIGRILRYLDYEFWGEPPFTRLRRYPGRSSVSSVLLHSGGHYRLRKRLGYRFSNSPVLICSGKRCFPRVDALRGRDGGIY